MHVLQPMRATYKLRGVGMQRCAGSWHIARCRHGRVVLGIRGHAHAKNGLMSSKYRWQIGWKASLQDTLQSGVMMRELSGAINGRGVQMLGETCTWHRIPVYVSPHKTSCTYHTLVSLKGCCKPSQLRWECLACPTNGYNLQVGIPQNVLMLGHSVNLWAAPLYTSQPWNCLH